jgi:hypothetical protein
MAAARKQSKPKSKSKSKKAAPARRSNPAAKAAGGAAAARKKPKAKPKAAPKPKPKPRPKAKKPAAPRPVKPDVTVRMKKPPGAPRTPLPEEDSARAAGVTVDVFQNAQPMPQRAIIAALRETVKTTVPDAIESIKWGQPVFELNGPIVFIRSAREHVTFGFWRGADLEAQGFVGLEGEGERMRHLKISSLDQIDHDIIGRLVDAAAELNRVHGDPTRAR